MQKQKMSRPYNMDEEQLLAWIFEQCRSDAATGCMLWQGTVDATDRQRLHYKGRDLDSAAWSTSSGAASSARIRWSACRAATPDAALRRTWSSKSISPLGHGVSKATSCSAGCLPPVNVRSRGGASDRMSLLVEGPRSE